MSIDSLRLQVSSGMVVAARHWRRICHNALIGYGISEACAAPLLMIVRLGDGVHQVAVAQAAGLESPSLVRLLDQLCKAGLVCRSEDPLDRRAKALSLTAEGRRLAEAIEAELVRVRHDVLQGTDEADLQAALRVLRAFEAAGLGTAGGVA
ncbi:TPA: winged helix DNA-binding protein [Pseudomonas putida]|uniref:MarR family winged helix-turn-helix transcriptional regulator n=1 Tax=Pseudomonas putida TaxID=303 RepID=UPI002364A724|nr:MarR family transcriptional regulator [Pseudomonas putida]MDD2154061.1 winged helix DNA-binding protein [Pseudomonas putida]HDS1682583.1 winged helix DNA-binding protein [Pseudomonas putida]